MKGKKSRPWRKKMYSVRVIGQGIVAMFPADTADVEDIKTWARAKYASEWFIQEVNVRVRDLKRSGRQVGVVHREMQQGGFFGAV